MTANVFGTPVYVYSADDPSNRSGKDGKDSTVSDRLQNALKAVKPLDSARLSLQKALDSLDGTAYEDIKQGIQACMTHVEIAEKKVVDQLGVPGGDLQSLQNASNPQSQGVPTAGQISGAEPLPEEGMAAAASQSRPSLFKKSQTDIEQSEREYLQSLADRLQTGAEQAIHGNPQQKGEFFKMLGNFKTAMESFVNGKPAPSPALMPAAQALSQAILVAMGEKSPIRVRTIGSTIKDMLSKAV